MKNFIKTAAKITDNLSCLGKAGGMKWYFWLCFLDLDVKRCILLTVPTGSLHRPSVSPSQFF